MSSNRLSQRTDTCMEYDETCTSVGCRKTGLISAVWVPLTQMSGVRDTPVEVLFLLFQHSMFLGSVCCCSVCHRRDVGYDAWPRLCDPPTPLFFTSTSLQLLCLLLSSVMWPFITSPSLSLQTSSSGKCTAMRSQCAWQVRHDQRRVSTTSHDYSRIDK